MGLQNLHITYTGIICLYIIMCTLVQNSLPSAIELTCRIITHNIIRRGELERLHQLHHNMFLSWSGYADLECTMFTSTDYYIEFM